MARTAKADASVWAFGYHPTGRSIHAWTPLARPSSHKWQFRARFRRHSFGWKSQPAIRRVKEAVSEIKSKARKDPVLAPEGAVLFLERVSPAIEEVDGSSGGMGNAVHNAVGALASIIADAPADPELRARWLERLFEAYEQDRMPYLERLGEEWGTLCASPDVASSWADRLIGVLRYSLGQRKGERRFSNHTSPCFSALYAAGRHEELIALLKDEQFWSYKLWAVKALAAQGHTDEALRVLEESQNPWAYGGEEICEEILLAAGRVEEAYQRCGLRGHSSTTHLAGFRAIAKKYPHKQPSEILADLIAVSPGGAGKWFAAAKNAGLFDEAIALVQESPCEPQTLTRAARDFARKRPAFAIEAGLAALRWLSEGHGYEVGRQDVVSAYEHAMVAAANDGRVEEVRSRISDIVAQDASAERLVARALAERLSTS